MPKSRQRKNHSKKAAAFKKRLDDRKKSFEKQMRSLYERQQQEAMEKQIANNNVDSEELEGLNVDDFKLELEPEIQSTPEESNFGIVEGVTSPPEK